MLARLAALAGRLCRDERGSAMPLFGLGIVVMFGFAALVIDGGRLYATKHQLQVAADAAALGAAREIAKPDGKPVETALRVAGANLPAKIYGGQVVASKDVEIGTWDKGLGTFSPGGSTPNAVRVTARKTETTFLAGLIGHPKADVAASALAWRVPPIPVCLLALNPTKSPALEVNGSAKLRANDCVVQVNSSAVPAIKLDPAAHLTSLRTLVVGSAVGSNYTPRPETGSPPMADPLQALPAPPVGGCNYNRYSASRTVTIQPGTYCGGLTIGNNAVVTFAPGLYVIDNGALTAGGTATLKGQGVTIYLRGGGGRLDLNGGPTMDLSAPTSGTYAGVLIYADRQQAGLTHHITGSASTKLDGVLYTPAGHVVYHGSSTAAITMLVADSISFGGSSGFQRYTSQTSVPLPAGFGGAGSPTGGMALLAK